MSDQSFKANLLLNNRKQFTARQSMDTLIAYAREQDEKIFVRNKKFVYGKALTVYSLLALPIIYFAYNISVGYWRKIYTTSTITTPIEAVQGNMREYFVPEIYLKERQVRKIELGLKDTEELKALFRKPAAA